MARVVLGGPATAPTTGLGNEFHLLEDSRFFHAHCNHNCFSMGDDASPFAFIDFFFDLNA